MITSTILFTLIGTLSYEAVISAHIDYEPIKITVNENFNAQPGQITQGLQTFGPGIVHQGANFFFKPQLNIPSSFIPSHIEALISSIKENIESSNKDSSDLLVDKVKEILKPLEDPIPDFPEIVIEEDKITDIIKPLENLFPEVIPEETSMEKVFMEEIKITEVSTPSAVEVIIEENLDLPPPQPLVPIPVIIDVEPQPIVPELSAIPETPVLPPCTIKEVIIDEIKVDEPVLLEQSVEVFPEILNTEIITRPLPNPVIVPEITKPFVLENIAPGIVEDVKVEESIEIFPPVAEISTGAVLPIVSGFTDSSVWEEISQTNPCTECVIPVEENLPPFILKPRIGQEVFTYDPIVSHISNVPKILLKNHSLRFPPVPFSKFPRNLLMIPKFDKVQNQFRYSISCAHNIVENRIAPNMIFRKKSPKLMKFDFFKRSGRSQ